MMEFYFSAEELLSHPEVVKKKGVTELEISDKSILESKEKLLALFKAFSQEADDVLLKLKLDISLIDRKFVDECAKTYCCLMFDFKSSYLEENRKFFRKKINILNEAGLVFGFFVDSADFATMKKFKLSLDEIVSYYPNHIYIQNENLHPTDKLSTQDIKSIQNLSFALETFYTYGRAVPWFMAVVQSLRVKPNNLISDFAEWQTCNNCSFTTSFLPESASFLEIEKMQLSFLHLKYDEKHLNHIFVAADNLIRLHAALSECDSSKSETKLSLSYNPEDLLSPYAMDLQSFVDEVCMEMCEVKVFESENGADFRIL